MFDGHCEVLLWSLEGGVFGVAAGHWVFARVLLHDEVADDVLDLFFVGLH